MLTLKDLYITGYNYYTVDMGNKDDIKEILDVKDVIEHSTLGSKISEHIITHTNPKLSGKFITLNLLEYEDNVVYNSLIDLSSDVRFNLNIIETKPNGRDVSFCTRLIDLQLREIDDNRLKHNLDNDRLIIKATFSFERSYKFSKKDDLDQFKTYLDCINADWISKYHVQTPRK